MKNYYPFAQHVKKIRDKDGTWSEVETYIREHSDTDFSHGIYSSCIEDIKAEMHRH